MGSTFPSLPPTRHSCSFELPILPLDAEHSCARVEAFGILTHNDCAWVLPSADWSPYLFQGEDRPRVCGTHHLRNFHSSHQDWRQLLSANRGCSWLWSA